MRPTVWRWSPRWLCVIVACLLAAPLRAEPPAGDQAEAANAAEAGPLNLPFVTGGGKQFWTDVDYCQGWRIQQNAVSGHCRLLDPSDVRQAWGTLGQCQVKLGEVQREQALELPRGKVVIVLHGLLRSRHQLVGLCKYLEKEGGYTVINFGYASSRNEVGQHAEALARVVKRCSEAEEINFVAHSLGNIVVRHYLADCTAGGAKLDPRIKRFVMLGPPNNGAEMAHRFRNNALFQLVWGKSGQQLADQWEELQPHLATPSCEFGIIAGARGTAIGLNPLVTGDDDMVVSVAETKLPGASDFLTLPVLHGVMMDDPQVRKDTLRFLQDGYFVSAEKRQPLPKEVATREQP